ncbi:uncharacterized protein BT62DRAFT_1004761 [Guyanagaster necrorhizus]|uniref:Uncharacterized protein n=1 Tax=Guyanagaster necrorhizus TaxID=856835 RepID=A0A9P8ATN2_9AGAR|nr:uncharacterized protein BT62DRAFT_1004761 [Guyanagaster necrorhizus MCA 3950]KAG7447186.1 hypothetical protein BT62DRAFT_1004761 [Guyanagaster necrorhizus MCA 3950]
MSQNINDDYDQSTQQPGHRLHGSNDPIPGDRRDMGGLSFGSDQGGQGQPESAFQQSWGGGLQQQGGTAGDWERGAGETQGGVPVEGHHHHLHHHLHHQHGSGQQPAETAQQAAQQPVSTTDKLYGKAEQTAGRMVGDTEMQMKGEMRQSGGHGGF